MKSPLRIGKQAEIHFNVLVTYLERYQKLEDVDLYGLAECASLLQKFEVASDHVEKNGEYILSGSRWYANPALKDMKELSQGFRAFIKEYALSPAARQGIKAVLSHGASLLDEIKLISEG